MSVPRRSRSAPQLAPSIAYVVGTGVGGHHQPSGQPKRQKSFIFGHTFKQNHGSSPLVAPAVLEKEDPFSLSGFFPSKLTEDEQQWKWLRVDEAESLEEEDESESDTTLPSTPALDVDKIIQSEDKMGILAFSYLLERMKKNGIARDIQLVSPCLEDDVVDSSDSLRDVLRARRLASEGVQIKETAISMSLGGLFSPVEEEEEYVSGWHTLVTGMFL